MRRMQKVFFWLTAVWLIGGVVMTVGLAPWHQGTLPQGVTMAGALILLAGLALAMRDLWHYPEPRSVAKRVLLIAAVLILVVPPALWFAVRRPCVQGWYARDAVSEVLPKPDCLGTYPRNFEDWLNGGDLEGYFIGMGQRYFSPWFAAALAATPAAVIAIVLMVVYRRLPRTRTAPLSPRRTMLLWLALVAVAAMLVYGLDGWGWEMVRRAATVPHVAVNAYRLADRVRAMEQIEFTADPDRFSRLGTPPAIQADARLETGICCEINGRRMLVGPKFGSGWLCREVDDSVPPTVHVIEEPFRKPLETLNLVHWTTDLPDRHVWGPWYEVGYSNIYIERHNCLRSTEGKYYKCLGIMDPH